MTGRATAACLVAVAVAAASCRDEAPRGVVHCYQPDGSQRRAGEGQGLDPLLRGVFASCFDSAPACEAKAKRDHATCRAVTPRWHCFGFPNDKPTTDPLAGIGFCSPSRALCDAARGPDPAPDPDPDPDADEPRSGPCAPADTVYCQAGEGLLCNDSERLCNLAADLDSTMLGDGHHAPAKCVARHSAR
jgi:hypothetical protein